LSVLVLCSTAGGMCFVYSGTSLQLALYPGLLSPASVACSTNTDRGRPGKTESRGMTYLDVWRSGTFLPYSCEAAFWIQGTSPRLSDVKRDSVLPALPPR